MSLSRLFKFAGIYVNATYLGHVGDQSVDNNLDHVTLFPAGSPYPVFTASKGWAPEHTVNVTDIASLIGLLSANKLTADFSAANVDLYYRECKQNDLMWAVTEATRHQVYRYQSCSMMWWEGITARQDDDAATIACKWAAYNAGAVDPLRVPAEAIQAAAAQVAPWTLGPVKINGAFIDGVQSVSIANNCQVVKHKGDGDAIPTLITIPQCRPVVTIETSNLRTAASYAREGEAITALVVYLKRRKPNKLCYADGDAQHIKITYEQGTLKWMGTRGDPATATLEAHIDLKSGSTYPWTIAAAQAIA